jgi:lipopolysaccharide export system protein LptC
MKLKDALHQVAHLASLYLPIMLMGVLAMGSWWLSRNTPAVAAEQIAKPPKHEPDYMLTKFVTHSFDKHGQLISELRGEKARHYPDTDVLEIDGVVTRSFKDKRIVTSSANRAYSNGDGSEVQLVGEALVVREAQKDASGKLAVTRLEIRSEFLHAFDHTQILKTHKPATIVRGDDKFSADSLVYDHVQGIAEMTGRVKATLAPKAIQQ